MTGSTFDHLRLNNQIVAQIMKAGGTAEDCAVALSVANDRLLDRVMLLEGIAPRRYKKPDGTNAAEPKNLKTSVKAAMEELTNASMGGVGDGGPTIEELDEIVARTGNCCAGDCDYHTIQRAWRLLQAGLDEKNPSDGHGG